MTSVQHLSMRVPWRDRPWDGFVCDDPINNSSCTLLANIGPKREDQYEQDRAGMPIESGDLQQRLPCLSERATFMSPTGYSVTKRHPYDWTKALKDRIHPTEVTLPGYAFEAVPFRWLSRKSLYDEVGLDRIPGFDPEVEDRADAALGWTDANWVMDGANQRAVIEAFFEPVEVGDSLVFAYLKHSPLQEARTDRLLVGAARVSNVVLPPMWNHTGNPPFFSSMWETVLSHSLRPNMADGILLPYQQLVPLLDAGVELDAALAWAPEGRGIEFSYVTEHLSDDAGIDALASLEGAARGMAELGIELPESALAWVAAQTERLWQARGPAPGLASVLAHVGVERPFLAARVIMSEVDGGDPWPLLEGGFGDRSTLSSAVRAHVTATVARGWVRLSDLERQALRMLSAFDISADQMAVLMEGPTEVELTLDELLENPYYASICTYGQPEHVPFTTIDRACFPSPHVGWVPPLPESAVMEGNTDRRRIEALLTDILESQGHLGDTVVPEVEALELANIVVLTRPPKLTTGVLRGCDLDADALYERSEKGQWSPIHPIALADASPAFKLSRFEETSESIRQFVTIQEAKPSYGAVAGARAVLDESLDRDQRVDTSKPLDDLEEQARTEKAAGLSALHDAPLSVLIGPAGTGKTTLLRVLVEQSGTADGGVLLLAPTGKARVQLETKVGLPAKTLASYLTPSKRYDGDAGRYLVWGTDQPRASYGLVVIDEASMLTEEMLAATLDAFSGVKRLVLVGDPRQLPPIGAGRPFVDLVDKLRPDNLSSVVRVAASFVELRVPRRQLPDGSQGRRHDLELAGWFGDRTGGAADDGIWDELRNKPDQPTVRYVPWGDRSPVQALTDALAQELPLDANPEPVRAFALTYGGTINGEYLNWEPGAGKEAESWQILSPTRSRAFGTVELNRHVKRTYRVNDTGLAQRNLKSNVASPYGPELIIRGDKVMQTTNRKQKAWSQEKGLSYVANGEIGVGIGRLVPRTTRPKNALTLSVEFSSQPGAVYSYWPSSGDNNILLELAWAVTVHKSQGSEFGTTFLMLPARTAVSRELMYTALTRQQDKVVILHDGTLEELRDLAQPWRSETARRLTDLFAVPEPVTLELRGQAKRFDRRLMHVSASGIPMASKNEVIIAGLLDQLVPGAWQYEQIFRGKDGREVKPDFTISLPDGRTVLWEHAGMLDVADYKTKWEKKRKWYADNGVLPHDVDGGPTATLMWTDDLAGANAQQWLGVAGQVLGVTPGPAPAAGGQEPVRRTAKKARRKDGR